MMGHHLFLAVLGLQSLELLHEFHGIGERVAVFFELRLLVVGELELVLNLAVKHHERRPEHLVRLVRVEPVGVDWAREPRDQGQGQQPRARSYHCLHERTSVVRVKDSRVSKITPAYTLAHFTGRQAIPG